MKRKALELEGKVWKDSESRWWLAEIFFLDVATQGKTRQQALAMIRDAMLELLKDSYGDSMRKHFELTVNLYEGGVIGMRASDARLLLALGLKRRAKKRFQIRAKA
jgi:predicted RNase H-like HicB family nuclease